LPVPQGRRRRNRSRPSNFIELMPRLQEHLKR
jgi:hypothetical protein